MSDPTALRDHIQALLDVIGTGTTISKIEPCASGGNNRVYRVDAGGLTVVAKHYFRDSSDPRDRLNAEYSFLEYAAVRQIDCVPKPLARDDRSGIALYEYVEGHKLYPGEISQEYVDQAREFFLRLNARGRSPLGDALPTASEASFSIDGQLDIVQRRVERLSSIPAVSDINQRAIRFVDQIQSRWFSLRQFVLAEFERHCIDSWSMLALEDRCISPSDFGFHNALLMRDGKVDFIDFEYAGWDDPAKAISDFFSHPAVPVPLEHFDRFLESVLKFSPNSGILEKRTRILFPVFQMKWCCIVMNDFFPSLWERRKFADPELDETTRKRTQLEKAQQLLEMIPR